jgi:hypothetical protein
VPTADDLRGLPPKEKEVAPPPPQEAPAVPPDASPAFAALAQAAQALEEAALRAEWQAKNDSTLGVADRGIYRHKAIGLREGAQIVREIEV